MQGVVGILAVGLIFGSLVIYGYVKEKQITAWEKRTLIKVCRYIYNKIVSYEQWRNLRRAGNIAKSLFADTYKYQERYELFSSVFDDEHPMVISSGGKWFACSQLIQQNGLEESYRKYCESQVKEEKNNRVSGN